MPNTKEKIIELHKTLCASLHCNYDEFQNAMTIDTLITAENLIANGVTIPVRCKDCKHNKLPAVLTQKYGEPGTLTCHNWHSPCNKRNVKPNDFCSRGERKDND